MKFALWPLSMNVVSAKAASPRGAGSATGRAAAGVARVQARWVARLVEELAREHVDVAARDARLHRLDRSLERFVNVLVVGGELLGRLADYERARHVGVAGRLPVARPEVEHDRLIR